MIDIRMVDMKGKSICDFRWYSVPRQGELISTDGKIYRIMQVEWNTFGKPKLYAVQEVE